MIDFLRQSATENQEAYRTSLLHLECPCKFSHFGKSLTDEVLKKRCNKDFLFDFDINIFKGRNSLINIKEGFSCEKTNDLLVKNHKKYSFFFENNDLFSFEAKISQFSLKKMKFNFYSNLLYLRNLKIYSFFKPYYSQNYSFSKIGFMYCGTKLHVNTRVELDDDANIGFKTVFFPNSFSFIGGLVKLNPFKYNLETLSLILGIKREDLEFIFKNETFYKRNVKKISLNVGQIYNEKISLAAKYRYIIEGKDVEKTKINFGIHYTFRNYLKSTLCLEQFKILKLGTFLKFNDYFKLMLSYQLNFGDSRKEIIKNISSPVGICIKINLI